LTAIIKGSHWFDQNSFERSGNPFGAIEELSNALIRWLGDLAKKDNIMNGTYQSLSYSKWDCKYHVVFVRKYRRKVLFGQIRKHLGKIFNVMYAS
jgi:Transposase IS200 like